MFERKVPLVNRMKFKIIENFMDCWDHWDFSIFCCASTFPAILIPSDKIWIPLYSVLFVSVLWRYHRFSFSHCADMSLNVHCYQCYQHEYYIIYREMPNIHKMKLQIIPFKIPYLTSFTGLCILWTLVKLDKFWMGV